ncbi:hypothetical protein [Alicyclobacillus herbarius]|uniref:hypothetical protein n=1 Tax=Alicyclobacillus herbarius TaxID=122960 RepID=UPI0012DC0D23|nr:hypothetical protein [Alicyclobacillus herbarius]
MSRVEFLALSSVQGVRVVCDSGNGADKCVPHLRGIERIELFASDSLYGLWRRKDSGRGEGMSMLKPMPIHGYRIRQGVIADAAQVAKVNVDSWRSTYRGIVSDAFLDSLSYVSREQGLRERLQKSADPTNPYAMFVVEDTLGRIVGFADGGPERSGDPRYDGELYAIYQYAP